jgi:hypothetical protein
MRCVEDGLGEKFERKKTKDNANWRSSAAIPPLRADKQRQHSGRDGSLGGERGVVQRKEKTLARVRFVLGATGAEEEVGDEDQDDGA